MSQQPYLPSYTFGGGGSTAASITANQPYRVHTDQVTDKSDQFYEERGFDFGFAAQAFLDPEAIHKPDTRINYGEDRFRLYGRVQGRPLVVVYTKREGRIRIITAWKASTHEVQART